MPAERPDTYVFETPGEVALEVDLPSGSVLVSRLRPYLRQIGFVDAGLAGDEAVVCSTEMFVLRPRDRRSVAFLAAYLLRKEPQAALAASVEGGHHPRFSKGALLELPVPSGVLRERERLSASVESAIRARRRGERLMQELIASIPPRRK